MAATHAILELFVARIVLQALRVRLQSLVVLLGEELHVSLTRVALHERGVDVDALFRILQRLVERREFRVRGRAIGVGLVIVRVARDGLGVLLDRLWKLLLLEESVTSLARLVALDRVQIRRLLRILQFLLGVVQTLEGVRRSVLGERSLVRVDGRLELTLLDERVALARHRFCDHGVIRTSRTSLLDGGVAIRDARDVITLLQVGRRAVVQERHVLRVQFNRLVVIRDRGVEIALLIRRVTRLLRSERFLTRLRHFGLRLFDRFRSLGLGWRRRL